MPSKPCDPLFLKQNQKGIMWYSSDGLVSKISVDCTANMIEHIDRTSKIKHEHLVAVRETTSEFLVAGMD